MSPAMAARWALVCALIGAMIASFGGTAHAERRRVAVVNLDLADQSAAKTMADRLDGVLSAHPDLDRLTSATDAAALKDPIEDPDRQALQTARDFLARAEAELVAFNYGSVVMYTETGQKALLSVSPPAAAKLYADLAFVRGQALVSDGRVPDALASFALVARLDPERTVDPKRFLPDVVKAWAQAKALPAQPGSITVDAVGRVWIDGVDTGTAPGGFAVPEGPHVVWVTDPAHDTGGEAVTVTANQVAVATIKPPDAPRSRIVQLARTALAKTPDATARAGAMNQLVKLVGADDAVLLHVSKDKVVVQTWGGRGSRSPGFGSLYALRASDLEKPVEILKPLEPPKQDVVEPPVIPVKPIVVKKWYQRRPVQLGIAAGVVAAVVGIYFAARAGADSFSFNPDFGYDQPTTGRR
ncbi:MAG: PEGA domain-containing protein [Myxococcales bacterium]|nr:PEGA domain-containing protein [Myxococcales bacterium]